MTPESPMTKEEFLRKWKYWGGNTVEMGDDLASLLAVEREAERERCAKIAEDEAELPGEPMEAMKTAMRERPIDTMRAAVVVTKRNIAEAIRDSRP